MLATKELVWTDGEYKVRRLSGEEQAAHARYGSQDTTRQLFKEFLAHSELVVSVGRQSRYLYTRLSVTTKDVDAWTWRFGQPLNRHYAGMWESSSKETIHGVACAFMAQIRYEASPANQLFVWLAFCTDSAIMPDLLQTPYYAQAVSELKSAWVKFKFIRAQGGAVDEAEETIRVPVVPRALQFFLQRAGLPARVIERVADDTPTAERPMVGGDDYDWTTKAEQLGLVKSQVKPPLPPPVRRA